MFQTGKDTIMPAKMDLNFGRLPDRGVYGKVFLLVKKAGSGGVKLRGSYRIGGRLGYLGDTGAAIAHAQRGADIGFLLVLSISLGRYRRYTWFSLGKGITAWQAGQEGDVECKYDFYPVHAVKVKHYSIGLQTGNDAVFIFE